MLPLRARRAVAHIGGSSHRAAVYRDLLLPSCGLGNLPNLNMSVRRDRARGSIAALLSYLVTTAATFRSSATGFRTFFVLLKCSTIPITVARCRLHPLCLRGLCMMFQLDHFVSTLVRVPAPNEVYRLCYSCVQR